MFKPICWVSAAAGLVLASCAAPARMVIGDTLTVEIDVSSTPIKVDPAEKAPLCYDESKESDPGGGKCQGDYPWKLDWKVTGLSEGQYVLIVPKDEKSRNGNIYPNESHSPVLGAGSNLQGKPRKGTKATKGPFGVLKKRFHYSVVLYGADDKEVKRVDPDIMPHKP